MPREAAIGEGVADAAGRYSDGAALLVDAMNAAPREEYERLEATTVKARDEARRARLAFEAHVAEHGCRKARSRPEAPAPERTAEDRHATSATAELIRQANVTGVEFLIADIDLALAMLERAGISRNEETIARNLANAEKAHRSVSQLLEHLSPTPEARAKVEQRLDDLSAALTEASGGRRAG